MATWRVIQFGGPRVGIPSNNITVVWYVMSCDVLDRPKRFGITCCFHFQ